jgi:hypothetical protein
MQAAAFSEGTDVFEGGTKKAEAAKLQGAGIRLKQCSGKGVPEKGSETSSVRIGMRSRLGPENSGEIIRNEVRPSDQRSRLDARGCS